MPERPIGNRRRVIVVDDDQGVRVSVARSVERGFDVDVEAFSRGADAVARGEEVPITLAILDLDMPELNGVEVARALRESQPSLVILFLTGSVGDFPAPDVEGVAPRAVLNKPVTTAVLTAAVREALE